MIIPTFADPKLKKFLVDWERELNEKQSDNLSKSRANHSILLLSPGRKTYEVTVSDTGTLTATLVQG